MNWYKKAQQKKRFIGNCREGLKDPLFQRHVASDATELAQLVERGKQINFDEFAKLTGYFINDPQKYEFYIDEQTGITWYYNIDQDVEYFYV